MRFLDEDGQAVAVGADGVAQRAAEDHKGRAKRQHPEILGGVGGGFLVCAQKRKQGRHPGEHQHHQQQSDAKRCVDHKGAVFFHELGLARAQRDGAGGTAAEADQRVEGGDGGENRACQRDGGKLKAIACPADKEYVRHVIQHGDHHDQNDRKAHLQKKLPDAALPHQRFMFHNYHPPNKSDTCFFNLSIVYCKQEPCATDNIQISVGIKECRP